MQEIIDYCNQNGIKYGIDSSQVPIFWVASNGTVPILGITKPSHATTLAQAMEVILTQEELDLIEKEAKATGDRYILTA